MTKILFEHIAKPAYNIFVRPYLPQKIAVYNGVPIRAVKLFDQTVTFPEYEEALIGNIRKYARNGDTILQVGGGRGPSAVAAARAVEPDGEVIVYEGGKEYVEKIQETLDLNGVRELVKVKLGTVGEGRNVWGDSTDTDIIDPEKLPECDILVLDCEGAEQVILPQLEIKPEILIVESHGDLGSPTSEVKQNLQKMGYKIKSTSPEVPKEDVYVVAAVRPSQR